jgi:hypothetical protein
MAKKSAKTRELHARLMPGFNAEASLYATDHRYRQAGFSGSGTVGGNIHPQIFCHYNPDVGGAVCCNCDPYSGCSCGPVGKHTLM